MFSKNNKISKRQMFRLLTYDLLGIGTLLLPSALASQTQKNGMLAIVIGIAAGILYCFLIGWLVGAMEDEESYPIFLKRSFGTVIGTVAFLFYAVYYIALGGYVTYIFGHLIVTELLKEQSFYWIVIGILGLAAYGIVKGIEGRARIYEILFWFLMAPLFLMLFLSARDVEVARLFPLYGENVKGVLTGAYFSFEVFSLGGFALFLTPFAKEKKSIRGAGLAAVLFSGLVLLAIYGVLQGIFGVAAMERLEYPAVTLMSMIQIPGGFLQRQDALMVAIWFFTVFALLSSSLFYAAENLKEFSKGKKESWWIALAAVGFFGIAVCSYRSAEFTDLLHRIFLLAATPLVVLIPLFAGVCVKCRGKGRKALYGAAILGISLLYGGCSTMELENRQFPLAMGIDIKEDSCLVSFKFQDLSGIADQNADAPGGTDFYIEDKDFFTGITKYANDSNKMMDYNHMKALVLSEEFAEDTESLQNFLQICNKESLIARNTLLFFAKDAAEILLLDQNLDIAIGAYLEEMVESREDYSLKDAVTLGDLYNDMANEEQLLLIPVLEDSGGLPVIRKYYAVSGGELKGEVAIEDTILSYLSQGKLKKLQFSLEDGTPISINRIRVKGDFARGESVVYHNKIRLEVVVEKEIKAKGSEGEKIKKQIEALFLGRLQESSKRLLHDPGIDLSNSFYKLGMYDREKYERWKGDFPGYLKDLECEFFVEAILLNERG